MDFYELLGNFLAADEDSVILVFNIWSKESNDAVLKHYSYDGKLLGQVHLADYFGEGVQFYQPETIYKLNGKYYTVIQHSVKGSDSFVDEGFEIDFENSTLKDPFALKLPDDGSMFSEISTMMGVGDKLVYLMSKGDFYSHSYMICVVEGGKTRTFVPDFGADAKLSYIANFMKYGDGVAFTAETTENGVEKKYFCTLDIDTFTMQKTERKDQLFRASFIPDCGVFDCNDYKAVCKVEPRPRFLVYHFFSSMSNLKSGSFLGSWVGAGSVAGRACASRYSSRFLSFWRTSSPLACAFSIGNVIVFKALIVFHAPASKSV